MHLGSLIRAHRKQQKLTLKTVAEKARISEGFLSQVENNVKTPSLASLVNICEALDLNAGDLVNQLQNQERIVQIKRSEWDEVDISHTGFATRRFMPPENREVIDSAVLFIQPGRSIPVRKNIKNVQEILCILQGHLELTQGDRRILLGDGDAAHFWSETDGQRITNTGDGLAVALWVGTI